MSQTTSNELSKSRKNKKQQMSKDDLPELNKEETKIAKFLRLSCPNKQGSLMGMKVDFFIGNKLVDLLMESKWGPGLNQNNNKSSKDTGKQPFLASRQACINFMQRLMHKQLFYRAVKIYKEQNDNNKENSDVTPNLRKRKNKEVSGSGNTPPLSSSSASLSSSSSSSSSNTVSNPSSTPSTSEKQLQQQQKDAAKKKFKLEMHEDQKFVDSNEPYVWFYDPTSTKTYIIGSLLILGAIGICLFPLWPSQVREGVYYLSLAGASFLGAILGLIVLKYILFGLVWGLTFGKLSFWIFPNLTEDVGFFESFVPFYKVDLGSKKESIKEASNESNNESSLSNTKSNEEEQQQQHKLLPRNDSKNKMSTTTTTTELSKSTLEINTSVGTPRVSKSAAAAAGGNLNKDSKEEDEEGFELVDDDDLVKVKKSNDEDESDN